MNTCSYFDSWLRELKADSTSGCRIGIMNIEGMDAVPNYLFGKGSKLQGLTIASQS